jgi:hypothetical protein
MSTTNEGTAMSDHQHDDHGVEDLDVPESDAEHVVGGIIAVRKAGGLKIDRVGLKITDINS